MKRNTLYALSVVIALCAVAAGSTAFAAGPVNDRSMYDAPLSPIVATSDNVIDACSVNHFQVGQRSPQTQLRSPAYGSFNFGSSAFHSYAATGSEVAGLIGGKRLTHKI